jgi:hypothetical protein
VKKGLTEQSGGGCAYDDGGLPSSSSLRLVIDCFCSEVPPIHLPSGGGKDLECFCVLLVRIQFGLLRPRLFIGTLAI